MPPSAASGLCTPENLNQAFIESVPWVHEQIADPVLKFNYPWWVNAIPKADFEMGQGYIKSKWQFHGTPAPQQDAYNLWMPMKKSAAEGDDPEVQACNPPVNYISFGWEKKSYRPYELNIRTDDICLTDLSFDWQFVQQMEKIAGALRDVTGGVWENWNRDNYHAHTTIFGAGNPLQVSPYAFKGASQGELPNISGMQIGTLSQGLLDFFYPLLSRRAGQYALGNESGAPMFGLITSQEESDYLLAKSPHGAREVLLQQAANGNDFLLKGMGAVMTYRRYMHMLDVFPPRYKVLTEAAHGQPAGSLMRVWPFTQSSTTIGDAWDINPEYLTTPLQISTVYMNGVVTNRIPPVVTNFGGGANRAATVDYMGMPRWWNEVELECNPDGEIGHWRMKYRVAPEPGNHNYSIGFLHKRCDVPDVFDVCAEDEGAGGAVLVNILELGVSGCDDGGAAALTHQIQLEGPLTGANVGDSLTVTFNDGTTLQAELTAVDHAVFVYEISYSTARVCTANGGIDTVTWVRV